MLYDLFEAIGPLVPQSQNMLLSTILAGVTVGTGVGIVVKAGCASGETML